jgi:hypothetical protein
MSKGSTLLLGRRRPDTVVVDWDNKVLVLGIQPYIGSKTGLQRAGGISSKSPTCDILIKSLERVARDTEGENEGWKIRLIIFVGGICGSVNVKTFNDNMNELHVIESKRNAIRKGLAFELLNAQDTVLCSYFAQRSGGLESGVTAKSKKAMGMMYSKDWATLSDTYARAKDLCKS